MMSAPTYSFRLNLFARERRYEISPDVLHWTAGRRAQGSIKYDEVKEVRLYRKFMRGKAALNKEIMWDAHLYTRSNRLILSRLHYVRFGTWEDRSTDYRPFANVLLSRLRACNPNLRIVAEHHWTMRLRRDVKRRVSSIGGRILVLLFPLVCGWNPVRTADVAACLMRVVGPFLRGHRVARANLQAAFSDKTQQEIDQILRGMWDNFGRVTAEYASLDRLWDYEPTQSIQNRIVLNPTFVEAMSRLHRSDGPALFFGAHLANWELPPIVPAVFGVRSAMLYRPPDSRAVADEIMQRRAKIWGSLIAARPGAALQIRSALRRRVCVGMLVDQHSAGGVEVSFFGRPCKANPTLARLARKFDCPVFGARAIRLPGYRYRLELTDALQLPRDPHGKIEVAATMQMITSIIEGWIREHPEQWLWMHRRWR
jgi:Kdo2-lipid IVA lauroyltransferase/acyltransferase